MLTIGRLARAAGVGVATVRYYQRRGLLREPRKPSTGRFRSYSERDLEQLLLIKYTKDLGFTLGEIARLMRSVEAEDFDAVRKLAQDKLDAVTTQIRTLNNRKGALKTILKECPSYCHDNCPLYKRFKKSLDNDTN
ncbi:MAG: MerR family transcriptional regulator [Gammaproteobacteria bacterium]|nr:MerR family transcriptional regulator [Gammaproteobacteria bacterium]MCW8840615.1 MerR family transcriptional regulator [Gammaproteobacteria bacterium]MCW8959840.1 MerR family transcriptional regulator [Gammaproteobacteria bacterium]MCW8972293.1 MerR family transcriptional regulator [Gammaproteobacteria bacterium]MCW8993747.1 MerR family transcriptional regulator [Gammaproteobacteria bacterium]